jgi:hypothetical protein
MRHRWPVSIAVAVLSTALATGGLGCARQVHHAAAVSPKPKRTYIPPPVPTNITVTLIKITGLEPSSGPPGTVVTLTGVDLASSSAVCFGRWAATGVKGSGGTRLSVVAPAGTGTVNVVVGNAFGASKGVPFTFTGSAVMGGSASSHCASVSASASASAEASR